MTDPVFIRLPQKAIFARIQEEAGCLASLVSSAGAALVPAEWQLVCQLAGEGSWLILAPRVIQPDLF